MSRGFSFVNNHSVYAGGGGTIGAIWYFIVTFINNDFTFFNVPASNRLVCDKPKKKHMRCTAYKNGLITKSYPVG